MAKSYEIPFDKKGNQMSYDDWGFDHWKPNFEFTDTLTLQTYERGRSSVTFTLARTDGTTVSMFVSDFIEVAKKMRDGKITGTFSFAKKGTNYGCYMVSHYA